MINVILKSADHGGSAAADVGQTGDGDGFTHGGGGNIGLAFGDSGFVNLTAEYRAGGARCAAASMSAPVGATTFPWAIRVPPAIVGSTPVSGWATISSVRLQHLYSAQGLLGGQLSPGFGGARRCIRTASHRARNSDEDDYAFLAGVRGERLLDAWHWDLKQWLRRRPSRYRHDPVGERGDLP